jgi:hypothetical protein
MFDITPQSRTPVNYLSQVPVLLDLMVNEKLNVWSVRFDFKSSERVKGKMSEALMN